MLHTVVCASISSVNGCDEYAKLIYLPTRPTLRQPRDYLDSEPDHVSLDKEHSTSSVHRHNPSFGKR